MSRNYGLGSRDMASAGRIALARCANQKTMSFSTVDTVADRWRQFATYAKSTGVGRMERITPELATAYGKVLAGKVTNGQLSPAYAQNLVSAINTVMASVRPDWKAVSPTKDCKIENRCAVRSTSPVGVERSLFNPAIASLRNAGLPYAATNAELARELGLRSKEGALLNAHQALKQAYETGVITVSEGTKGGRGRFVPITHERQITALSKAAALQDKNRGLIPPEMNWKTFRENELRAGREILKEHHIAGYHDLRAAYACERYQALTGHAAPVFGVNILDRELDKQARLEISHELGHSRIDVVSEYIGGRG